MPLKHLRVCTPSSHTATDCRAIRYAPCGPGCHLPIDEDPSSWRDNMQAGAGTMPPGRPTPIAAKPDDHPVVIHGGAEWGDGPNADQLRPRACRINGDIVRSEDCPTHRDQAIQP